MSRFSQFDYEDGLKGLPSRPFIDEDGKRAYDAGERARHANEDLADRMRKVNEEAENRRREVENEAEDARIQAEIWTSYTPTERIARQEQARRAEKERRDKEASIPRHSPPTPSTSSTVCGDCALEAFLLAIPWTIILAPITWLIVHCDLASMGVVGWWSFFLCVGVWEFAIAYLSYLFFVHGHMHRIWHKK